MASTFICKKSDIPQDGFKVFDVSDGKVLIANSEDVYYGYNGYCPHQEVCLAEALYDGRVLTCHEHLWQWDIVSGEPQGLAEGPLIIKPIEQINDEIYLCNTD